MGSTRPGHGRGMGAALRASGNPLPAVPWEARGVLTLVDAGTGRIVDCDPGFERLVGRGRGELLGRRIWEVRSQDMCEPMGRMCEPMRMKGRDARGRAAGCPVELDLARPDGSTARVEFRTSALGIAGRRLLLSIAREIPEGGHTDQPDEPGEGAIEAGIAP